jgi:predicted PurR-regulated permease PerM
MNGTFAGVGPGAFGAEGTAALAMLGGALSFVPYVGTIVAMVVRALAALPQGIDFAVYAHRVWRTEFLRRLSHHALYLSKTLSLPPVTLIFAIFVFTILFGMLGVILAALLTVVSRVALDTFYKPAKI